jgi:4-amino-4-deoxy-L-arabinose transferase-like glycosyltransferase
MLALLPLACFGLAAVILRRNGAREGRESALLAAVLMGILGVGVTELAGAAGLFTRGAVAGTWAVLALALAGVLFKARRGAAQGGGVLAPRAGRVEAALGTGLGLLAASVSLVAWAAAPNNWDSMTYHLPRVLHWIQNGSLGHYPTHVIRQLTLSPGAEYAVAQGELLVGSERLAAFVQTLAWLGCALVASLGAKDLGSGRLGQVVAAVFAATLPMAILQASSTQNDLVVAFWLLALAHFALRAVRGEMGLINWLAAGGSLGLALLTKATAFLYAFPFVLWLAAALWRSRRAAPWRAALAAGVLAVLINAAPWARNLALFGSPLGGDHGAVNASFTPAIVASNLTRNVALQLSSPSPRWNRAVERAVLGLHAQIGIDVNDPRSTWKGSEFRVPARIAGAGAADADEALFAMLHEDQAGNPVHLLLLLVAIGAVLGMPQLRSRRALVGSGAAVVLGFLLFSLVLRWQPWNARLELPLFLLAAPAVATALEQVAFGSRTAVIGALLLVCSLPWVLLNATRPLVGPESVLATPRLAQSFAARPALLAPLTEAARAVAATGCRRIGLMIGPDDPEYLLWAALRAGGAAPERVEHVGVTNRSARKASEPPFSGFAPCAVIVLAPAGTPPSGDEIFSRDWEGGRIAVRAATSR